MNWKRWHFAAALLPICLLSAQQPSPQAPQPANRPGFVQPNPEVMRKISEQWKRDRAESIAINDLAGHIQSLDDAKKLVDLIAAQFSKELPPRWATRTIRNRLARAEYESAYDPGSLIPEQHIADAWNDYLKKIGAPQESYITAAELHSMRDSHYVTSQLSWARGNQNIWTIPNIYAVGQDGKVANGCRVLEVLNILWQLADEPETLESTRELVTKGQLMSDVYKNPANPPAGTSVMSLGAGVFRTVRANPVEQAALQYMRAHGARALNRAIEDLLKTLFED